MKKFLLISTLLIVLCAGENIKECHDCVNYDQCSAALDIANKHDDDTLYLFRSAICGQGMSGNLQVPKVCCSVFSPTDEDNGITNHQNMYLLPNECGAIQGNRIVGGSRANLYEFPWMALIAIRKTDGPSFICGGSIINSRYVLTAAHCVKNKVIAGVRVGEYEISKEYDCVNYVCENHIQDLRVVRTIVHESFNKLHGTKNDIALLRVQKDIDFNFNNVDPICLPTTARLRNVSLTNRKGTVAGWGHTEEGTSSDVLLKVNITTYSDEQCGSYLNSRSPGAYNPDSSPTQFCAGALNKDSCNGDSGGPMMYQEQYNNVFRYVQYGIVSFGPRNCGSGDPGVYTDVRKYMRWILDHIAP